MSWRAFRIRLRHWEYWPFGILQAPLFVLWLFNAIRARSLFYFSASNPSIPTGGMMGESKYDILKMIPGPLRPRMLRFSPSTPVDEVLSQLRQQNMGFPLIFKPDQGERGWRVQKVRNEAEVDAYVRSIPCAYIVQAFVDLPLEYGVFYVRYPQEAAGRIVSLTGKRFLTVTGDGRHSVGQLIQQHDRAFLQWATLRQRPAEFLDRIAPAGERVELVGIGNHCLGTEFQDHNHLITDTLHASFDAISRQIPGFYFGRYDLRCASVADLQQGRVQIMELNGCGAEPSHIYQPGFSLWQALGVLVRHWQTMYHISVTNHKRGVPYLSFVEGRKIYRQFRQVQRMTHS